jgi:hypothetical protein
MYENQVWNLVDPLEGVMSIEHKWICKKIDMDVYIHKGSTCQKVFMTKFKRLTTTRLDLLVVMLVCIDYSSNHYIFYL